MPSIPGLLVEKDSCTATGNSVDSVNVLETLTNPAVGVIAVTVKELINFVSRYKSRS